MTFTSEFLNFYRLRSILGRALLLTAALLSPISSSTLSAQTQAGANPPDAARFGRASKPAAPELVEFIKLREGLHPLDVSAYYGQMQIHRAHVVMLAEQGIITKKEAAQILTGLKTVNERVADNPQLADYMRTETVLINETGSVGGKMHIGRSRNDLGAAVNRIYYRDQINRLIEVLIDYQKTLMEKARENVDTVMPAYTHRKQAQPITLGHYLMAHVESAGKSIQRLEDLYRRTNLNVLGSAASASTGWPLNRSRTMELLGFDGLVVNSVEGVASWDHIAELAAAISIHMSNLSRLASEIHNWSSDESGMVDLDESFAGTSSIMPQKKNPISLEMVKQSAGECLGALVGILSSLNASEYQHTRVRLALDPRYIEIVVGATKVMAGVTRTMEPQKERMRQLSTEGFSTMAELADTIARLTGLSFREAHEIVAHAVMSTLSAGQTGDQINIEMIQKARRELGGEPLNISREDVMAAINPAENVARRTLIGGPAPVAVQQMIDESSAEVRRAEARLGQRRQNLKTAEAKLDRAEQAIIATANPRP